MSKLIIEGGRRLSGRVRISGRKNAAVALIPAAVLAGPSVLENMPAIGDVHLWIQILQACGAEVDWLGPGRLRIDPTGVQPTEPPYDLCRRMRASYYLLGAMLGRFGRADVPLPGGDNIGSRPVDQHFKGLRALGAEIEVDRGIVRARADRLQGTTLYLDVVSVGATINTMLAAAAAEGTTVIHNAAREAHVVDLANYLGACGVRISGAGTDTVRVRGGTLAGGCSHALIPDDIEAATLLLAAAPTGGDILVEGVIADHLGPITAKLRECGAEVEENTEWVRVRCDQRLQGVSVKTQPFPGFPTDVQSQLVAVLATAAGTSFITETLHDDRFRVVPELRRMGAQIRVEGPTAIIEGVPRLQGAQVTAPDIRSGAALVLAALGAVGETVVHDVLHIDRGYENFEGKLRALGAHMVRED